MDLLLLALALGLGLGCVTAVAIGVINLAVLEAATSGRERFATGVALGGALADSVHATLAFVGTGRVIIERPEWVRYLAIAAAIILVAYAVIVWRRRKDPRSYADRPDLVRRGVVTGLALTLPNPGALAAWVTVAAGLWPGIAIREAVVVGIGVDLASSLVLVLLARYAAKLRSDHWLRRYIAPAAVVVLLAITAIGVVRAL